MSGLPTPQAKEKAGLMLETVGLKGMNERMPSELSGGQQQRVALARALALEPAVLLFDEPLSNLDARLRRSMREEIRSLQQRLSLTVAYVTHDQSEALAVSDHIIVMDQGVIAQRGAPHELYESPQSEFVAGFMGEAMLFDGLCDEQRRVGLGTLSIAAPAGIGQGPVKVAVRPEAWVIRPVSNDGLAARVIKRTYVGSTVEYTFSSQLGEIFVVSPEVRQTLAHGAPVSLHLADHGVSIVSSVK
jgi:iron(III) transport system ATP-binding protein